MFAVALTDLLSASAPVRLAAPAWRAVNVSETEAEFFANHFAQRLAKLGYSVTTRSELAELIGMERQRQLLGCSDADAANCIAELGPPQPTLATASRSATA